MKLEMVFSAPLMLRLQDGEHQKRQTWQSITQAIQACVKHIKSECQEIIPDFEISLLHNAYNEPELGEVIRRNDTYGFTNLYCDSGGLQIVSVGKTIDDTMKDTIYKNQSFSDFAFCFDEIPCRDMAKSSRADISTKIYYPEQAKECAIKTAHNINEQINALKKLGVNTKVFYIVQGNTIADMIQWVEWGWSIIEDKDYICGFAIADTCMGNGVLESVDMLIAYLLLNKMTRNKYKRLHLLGVGSPSRLSPVISLSHLIPGDNIVSFDSSTLSQSWLYGRMNVDGSKALSFSDEVGCKNVIFPLIDKLHPLINTHIPVNIDEFKEHCLRTFRSVSKFTDNSSDEVVNIASRAFVPASCVYQTVGMCSEIVKYYNGEKVTVDSSFKTCQTIDEVLALRNTIISTLPSSRIKRESIDFASFFV